MAHVTELPTLLVDDEPQLLHSASVVLRGARIPEVITVDDGREVMGVMAEREVGAVVLDLAMPHVTGRALLEVRRGIVSRGDRCARLRQASRVGEGERDAVLRHGTLQRRPRDLEQTASRGQRYRRALLRRPACASSSTRQG